MIKRYTREEMGALWADLQKKDNWHKVETAVLVARERLGQIPKGVSEEVAALVITEEIMRRADEIEDEIDHDLLAFVLAVTEGLSDQASPWYHDGLTSFDDEDTGLAMLMVQTLDIIIASLKRFEQILKRRAVEHAWTIMVGRTHNIHAKPYTFGLKLLNCLEVIQFHIWHLGIIKEIVGVGKIFGADGTYTLPPEVEDIACEILGLKAARISTQIIGRHIHFQYASALVALGNSLDKFAIDIRLMAGTDVGEVAEFKRPGAKGSSAMPGKSRLGNPIKSENVCSLAKLGRGYIIPAMECQSLWHERTLDNSAAERVYMPDLSIVVHFMLERFTAVIDKLVVNADQMMAGLNKTGGIIFAEKVMMALTETGMPRPEAYELCENLAMQTNPGSYRTDDGKTFRDLVYEAENITSRVNTERLGQCFDPKESLQHVITVFKRFDLAIEA